MTDDLPDREGAAEQLRAIIESIERLHEDRAAIAAELKDMRAKAKAEGFDVPTINWVVERRRKDPKAVLEADLLLETYEQALGCGAAATGVLQANLGADGVFQIAMGPAQDAGEKLTRATRARRDAVALAELSRQAREGQ